MDDRVVDRFEWAARTSIDPGCRAVGEQHVGRTPFGRTEPPRRLVRPPPAQISGAGVVVVGEGQEADALAWEEESGVERPRRVLGCLRLAHRGIVDPPHHDMRLAGHPGPVQPIDGICRVLEGVRVEVDAGGLRPSRGHRGARPDHHAPAEFGWSRCGHALRVGGSYDTGNRAVPDAALITFAIPLPSPTRHTIATCGIVSIRKDLTSKRKGP